MRQLPLHGPTHKERTGPNTGFLSLDDLAASQEELMLTLEFNSVTNHLSIEAFVLLPQDIQQQDIVAAYISLCDIDHPSFHNIFPSDIHMIALLTPAQTISFLTM